MEYKYINVPSTLKLNEIENNKHCFAPSKYSRLVKKRNVDYDLLSSLTQPVKKRKIIKVKEEYKYIEIGDIDVDSGFVNGNSSKGFFVPSKNPISIKNNDIVVSTVRTYRRGIGMIKDDDNNLITTPANLVFRDVSSRISKEYLFAVLRSDFFIEQILGFQNRGMYPRLDKDTMEFIHIPIPNDKKIIEYISLLVNSMLLKERIIRDRHNSLLYLIDTEIQNNQKKGDFSFIKPTLSEIKEIKRLDAGYYCEEFQKLIFRTKNYNGGFFTLENEELILIPGPSLELKIIGTRIDSKVPLPGFYRLITPKQITNYGTITNYEYIGTPAKIKPLSYGDILFGESGTGRTMVYLDDDGEYTINNAHAHILRPVKGKCTSEKAITIRCILQYYKEIGITDYLTVGGAGGHLSPSYFGRVIIPNFPIPKQKEISRIYHNKIAKYNISKIMLGNFSKYDEQFNSIAGIVELDKISKRIRNQIEKIIHNIVYNQKVDLSFDFLA